MFIKKSLLVISLLNVLAIGSISFAHASEWQNTHPRRVEVNHRLENQNHRIRHDIHNGSISRDEAQNLHQQDRGIRAEERADARVNGSHITMQEKHQLNHEENNVSQQIRANKSS
ncbi:hypothetical protein KTH71_11470 [Acinetobacter sp. WU_MDCI_Axc73]|nr:hypothetical protein [Acinetobacter sp. WU_MDCI_Axc73]